jgi:hypothetical protein
MVRVRKYLLCYSRPLLLRRTLCICSCWILEKEYMLLSGVRTRSSFVCPSHFSQFTIDLVRRDAARIDFFMALIGAYLCLVQVCTHCYACVCWFKCFCCVMNEDLQAILSRVGRVYVTIATCTSARLRFAARIAYVMARVTLFPLWK